MLIDSTYFINKLNLPQVGNTEGLADVNNFITQYEPEYLRCVLGNELYDVFINEVDGSGLPSEQRWIDLLEGVSFTYKNCSYVWNGFKPLTPALKISPIANYVFYQYVNNKVTDFTLIGEVQSTTDNNRVVSSVDRLVDTWNRMVDMNKNLYRFLKANKTVYPEWKICYDHCKCGCGCETCANEGCGHLFKKINSLGL